MRVVLDANVLASAFLSHAAPGKIITVLSRGAFELFLSRHILNSLDVAWSKPYFRKRITRVKMRESADWLIEVAETVKPATGIHGVAEDEEDDLVLATAVAAEADFLVTGDKYLLRIGEFHDIRIVSPRDFLEILLESA